MYWVLAGHSNGYKCVFVTLVCQGKERKYVISGLLFVAEDLDSWTLFVFKFCQLIFG